MRVYIAGRYDDRLEFLKVVKLLPEGWECSSRWLQGYHVTKAGLDESTNQFAPTMTKTTIAIEDLEDVLSSDHLLIFPRPGGIRGGYNAELGMALAKGIPVTAFVYTETSLNAFFYHPLVTRITSWSFDLLEILIHDAILASN